MRAVIVYESMFGNTHEVAEAIQEGIREADPGAEVTCVPVADAGETQAEEADLLVLGGPTHMRGMSRGLSRKMGLKIEKAQESAEAEGKAEPHPHHIEAGAAGPGVREWLDALPKRRAGAAAAFDTRGEQKSAGGAAHGIAKKLRRHGYQLIADPEGFVIEDLEGPLREGERDRAKRWAAELVRARTNVT